MTPCELRSSSSSPSWTSCTTEFDIMLNACKFGLKAGDGSLVTSTRDISSDDYPGLSTVQVSGSGIEMPSVMSTVKSSLMLLKYDIY